jgi:hypothetical protein
MCPRFSAHVRMADSAARHRLAAIDPWSVDTFSSKRAISTRVTASAAWLCRAWNDADAKNWIKAAKADEAKRQAVLAMTGEELRQTPEWLAWIAGR